MRRAAAVCVIGNPPWIGRAQAAPAPWMRTLLADFERDAEGAPLNERKLGVLADAYVLCGRKREAEKLFKRLLGLCNDVGLLAEEYDPKSRQMLGNFPQALSHLALINTARNLSRPGGPAENRSRKSRVRGKRS